jgi:uncharacterized SAM-binding protein YcdF (DUF218 family)
MNPYSTDLAATSIGAVKRRSGRRMAVVFVIVTTLFVAAWLGRNRLLSAAGQWLNVGEAARTCDYIVILPGGEETRPFVAAAMVKSGQAQTVLIPRVESTPDVLDGTCRPSHEIICDVLVRRGVPSASVEYIGAGSTNTYTDSLALREFLAGRPQSTVTVVTSDFHTRRARWIFGRVLAERRDEIHFVAAPDDRVDELSWWHSRAAAWSRVSEYGKMAAYYCLYEPWAKFSIGIAMLIAIAIASRGIFRRRASKYFDCLRYRRKVEVESRRSAASLEPRGSFTKPSPLPEAKPSRVGDRRRQPKVHKRPF